MKKFLIIFFLLPIKVFALYSEYGEYSDWVPEKIESSNLVFVEEERRYRWYKEIKNDLGYDYDNEDYLIDGEDYIYDDFSDWSTEQIEADDIEEKTIYEYSLIKPIRYISISNVVGSYDCFRITEIDIKVNGTYINYNPSCMNCSVSNIKALYNNRTNENVFYLVNDGSVLIDLNNYYNLWEIEVIIYLYDRGTIDKKFNLSFSSNNTYASKRVSEVFRSGYLVSNRFSYIVSKEWLDNPLYTNYIETDEEIVETYYRKVRSYKMYRYRNKIYMKYQIRREYVDGYYKEKDGYIKDSEDYIIYYRRRERTEIENKRYELEITEEIDEVQLIENVNSTVLSVNEEKEAEIIEGNKILSKLNFKIYIIILFIVLVFLMILL